MKTVRHFDDIGFTVEAVTHENKCSCIFHAYRQNGFPGRDPLAIVFIKYDGCSDWNFDSPVHFCDEEGVKSLGVLMARIWGMAAELIPEWSPD